MESWWLLVPLLVVGYATYRRWQTKDPIAGLLYVENAINERRERELIKWIESRPWTTAIVSNESGTDSTDRKVQHYGKEYVYTTRTLRDAAPIPDIFRELAAWLAIRADQIIVNKYEPGQGIAPHIDNLSLFGDTVSSLSLGSATAMEFTRGRDRREIILRPRSLLTLTGAARYQWTHSIPRRKADAVNGRVWFRETRISITFRTIKPQTIKH